MSTNFIQIGKCLDFLAPVGGVVSGQIHVLGADQINGGIFGVVQNTALEAEDAVLCVFGVWELPKLITEVIAVGAPLYHDVANARLTAVNADGFRRIGVAIVAGANGDTVIQAQLRPDGSDSGNGLILPFTDASNAHVAGEAFLLEQGADRTLAVPLLTTAATEQNYIIVDGVVLLPKAAIAIVQFDIIFWNDSTKDVTNNGASNRIQIGYALNAQLSGDADMLVRIKDDFFTPVP